MINDLLDYLILGFVQGVTEFFPISSSGHLVLFKDLLEINNSGASAEIIAYFGTLFSIILFYRATFFSNKNNISCSIVVFYIFNRFLNLIHVK